MSGEIANLNTAVVALDANVTAVEGKVSSLNAKLAELESRDIIDPAAVAAATTQIDGLNGRLAALALST